MSEEPDIHSESVSNCDKLSAIDEKGRKSKERLVRQLIYFNSLKQERMRMGEVGRKASGIPG